MVFGILLRALLLGAIAAPSSVLASPLLDPRVGGLSLIGPASSHLASAHYNPAALALSPGHHLLFDGTLRLGDGSIARRQVDSTTGAPRDGYEPAQDFLEIFPQFFLGASSTFGSERVVLALLLSTPVAQRIDLRTPGSALAASDLTSAHARSTEDQERVLSKLFDPGQQGPARYHLVDHTLYHLDLQVAASYRIIDELIIGVSAGYSFGQLDTAFVRDAALEGGTERDASEPVALNDCGQGRACGYEHADAAEVVRVRGQSHGLEFGAGLLVRPHPKVDLGLGYRSEVVGFGGDQIPAKGDAWVLRSPASLATWQGSSPVYQDLEGRATATYSLPHMLNLGVVVRPNERLVLDGQVRWQHLSTHRDLSIQLTGTQFRDEPRMPDRITHYRGFQDMFAFQLGAGYRVAAPLVLQGAVMLETSAVPEEAVNAAAIDALKVDSFLGLHWTVGRGVTLLLGYGLMLMPPVEVESSAFSPDKMVSCVDNRYSLDLPACTDSGKGLGLPSAAGRYSLMTHRVGLGLGYDVW